MKPLVPATLAALSLVGCHADAPFPERLVEVAGPVREVTHPEPTEEWPQPWSVSAEPRLVLGASGAQPLSSVGSSALLSDGSVVVADQGAGVVYHFEVGTQVGRAVGGNGSGPGEFQEPTEVRPRPDGGFTVWDATLWRRSNFDADGVLISEETLRPDTLGRVSEPPMYPWRVQLAADGAWLSVMQVKDNPPEGEVWYRPGGEAVLFDAALDSFERIARFGSLETALVEAPWGLMPVPPPLAAETLVTADPSAKTVCVGDQARPEVHCVSPGHTTLRIIWDAVRSPARPDDPEVLAWRTELTRDYGPKIEGEAVDEMVDAVPLPAYRPLFSRLLLDELGFLWVVVRKADRSTHALVFDANGSVVGRVELPDVRPLWIGSHQLVGLVEGELGEQTVQLLDLTRSQNR